MAHPPLRIVLFSEINSPFGYDFLLELTRHDTLKVVGVVTQPDTKSYEYYRVEAVTVNIKTEASRRDIPVLQPERINKAARSLELFDADFFIVANYQQILAREVFELPTRSTLNFHPSLLPAYAGLWPFFWMARNHETESGVSVIAVNEIIDAGDIVDQIPIKLHGNETEDQLRAIHFTASITLLKRVIDRLPTLRTEEFQRQDLSKRSYYGKKDYLLARLSEPKATIEPPSAPIAAAIANAIFGAT